MFRRAINLPRESGDLKIDTVTPSIQVRLQLVDAPYDSPAFSFNCSISLFPRLQFLTDVENWMTDSTFIVLTQLSSNSAVTGVRAQDERLCEVGA